MRTKEEMAAYQAERRARLRMVESGELIGEVKREEMEGSRLPVVGLDEPCKVCMDDEMKLDLERDLGLDLERDLGITGWTRDGIFIRPDISIKQVQNIARLIHARHGVECPIFRECS